MVPKSSPFQDRFNEIIRRIVEAGIQYYQHNLAIIESEMNLIRESKRGFLPEKSIRVIIVDDLKDTFTHYLELNAIAFGVFLLELLYSKFGARMKKITFKMRGK
jgi:hypothetical protein